MKCRSDSETCSYNENVVSMPRFRMVTLRAAAPGMHCLGKRAELGSMFKILICQCGQFALPIASRLALIRVAEMLESRAMLISTVKVYHSKEFTRIDYSANSFLIDNLQCSATGHVYVLNCQSALHICACLSVKLIVQQKLV